VRDLILTPRGLLAFGRLLPCTVGRGGLTGDKREGDGATPRGVHRVEAILYRPDRMARPARGARPIRPGDGWSDDPRDPAYNRMVRHSRLGHEEMRRPDPLYDLVLVLDWNRRPPVPGRGSAIFVHRWRRPGAPTAGCIALRAADLRWLARRLTPRARVRV
jgi:L,D-peptidoglycan transpeptidase YkuD (ErfK/YbiS/YcfS/YnhG family)